ncbi:MULTISPECIES: galactofuranose ABC transporter, permease protein YjfF [unclassified Kitasatospora]|uniref:galactofuranose ABC transporter, permease protein YjfF n=1 Tax=unclassified Kitasatospora TaxID=2633591 RepID=UPI000B0AA542|nr:MULTISPECIES: galactofuranose ABC transporter, permease protein YjfF [unclassified Kitasatospora]
MSTDTVLSTLTRRGRGQIPMLVTSVLLVVMFAAGSVSYDGFLSGQVLLNLLIDNAFLLVVAVGMTFVILTGGIDLSVGAMVALSTMISAWLVQLHGWPPLLVIPLVLAIGTGAGLAMGWVIHTFEIQPFIVTLAGMFLARGLCYTISIDSISITDPTYTSMAQTRIPLGELFISPSVLIAVLAVVAAFVVLHYSRFGRNVYALGGSEQSSVLMGLPVSRTKIGVYGVSGFCSALGGVLMTFYMLSGYGLHAVGLELDAIAAVVIGGTLLTGGTGYLLGTVLGVLVLGLIQTVISFQGTLSSWWTRIVIGALLFVFILLQRVLTSRRRT